MGSFFLMVKFNMIKNRGHMPISNMDEYLKRAGIEPDSKNEKESV